MTRYLVLCSSLVMAGCSGEASSPLPSAPEPLAERTRVIVIAADGSTGEAVQEVKSSPLPSAPEPLAVRTRVIVVAADGSTEEAVQEVTNSAVVGDYRVGDGLGYNLHLVLKKGGRFECTWTGCLGVYGTSSGEWSIQDSGLKLVSREADGMFENAPLDGLLIVSFQEHYLLLQNEDRDWFNDHGPDTLCCFHKQEARKPLEAEWFRRIKEEAKR